MAIIKSINNGNIMDIRGGGRPIQGGYNRVIAATGDYPNKPANFTNTREIDFSQTPPTTEADQPIAGSGSPGWSMIYSDGTLKQSDPTAPMSPNDVWRMHFQAGTYAESWGSGNVYTNLTGLNIAELYTSVHFQFSANYPWHNISNKFLWWTPSQLLCQSNEGGRWLHATSQAASQWLSPGLENGAVLNTYKNDEITSGVWHQVECVISRSAKTWKIWLDNDLKIDGSNLTIADPYFEEFLLEAYRGGGGETLAVDCYNYWDHIHLAWA